MMRVLIDTDVVLDLMLKRAAFFAAAYPAGQRRSAAGHHGSGRSPRRDPRAAAGGILREISGGQPLLYRRTGDTLGHVVCAFVHRSEAVPL